MKTAFKFCIFLSFGVTAATCRGQAVTTPPPTPFSIVHRELNERTWQRTIETISPTGQAIPQVQTYRELGTSLCYVGPDGKLLDSQQNISILPDGSACSTNGAHQVYWPADIANGTIRLIHEGITLTSRPIGLGYDTGTQTVLLAVLTNSVGELISSNEILYPNAFVGGGIQADLLYINRRSGSEQDVIIRSQLPAPEQFGFNSSDTKLQLLTEFFNPPAPVQSVGPVNPQDGLQDTAISFGSERMVPGRAFLIGDTNSQDRLNRLNVYKSWTEVSGRTVLIEQIPYHRISDELAGLPASTGGLMSSANSILLKVSSRRLLPPARLPGPATNSIQLTENDFKQKPGLLCDYTTIDSAETNFTFCGDTTYFINTSESGYYFYGTTTIEGDSVIKMPNIGGYEGLLIIDQNGTVNCQTAPYRPAIFTSTDDNSVGSPISGSTGNPVYNENYWALEIDSTNACLHDLRFCYAWVGVGEGASVTNTTINVTNCQFIDGDDAIYANNANLYNVLIARSTNADPAIETEGPSLVCENVTADGGNSFIEADYAGATISLTNCLITGQPLITNSTAPIFATNAVVWLPSPSVPVYQTVGAGRYYLTNDSPYREQGTTNIDSNLLADLASKTTWPPILYDATNLSSLGTLGPVVPRDISYAPDIGYHYPAIDYLIGGCDLGTNLTVTLGTAIGWFNDYDPAHHIPDAIALNDGANLSFNGTATQPCYFAESALLQEGGGFNWYNDSDWVSGAVTFNGSGNTNLEPELSGDFLKWTSDGNANPLGDSEAGGYGIGSFKNCEFYSGQVSTYNALSLDFTNCLLFREAFTFYAPSFALNFDFENCTFYNGQLAMVRKTGQNAFWTVENSTFDGTLMAYVDSDNGASGSTAFEYNAYNTNNLNWQTYGFPYSNWTLTNTLEDLGSSDVMTTNYNWESSWFGDFYLPSDSPLIDAGSTDANYLGLYHFTTQTNSQSIEGDSMVDIGYHYVATGQYGAPLDNNGDGIPDYIEDANGNGLVDSGEINWMFRNDPGLSVNITQPRNGSTVP